MRVHLIIFPYEVSLIVEEDGKRILGTGTAMHSEWDAHVALKLDIGFKFIHLTQHYEAFRNINITIPDSFTRSSDSKCLGTPSIRRYFKKMQWK